MHAALLLGESEPEVGSASRSWMEMELRWSGGKALAVAFFWGVAVLNCSVCGVIR